jgi:hypothetical protein
MKIPRNKLEASLLAGIFVGEGIYYTGRVHTPIRKLAYNIFSENISDLLKSTDFFSRGWYTCLVTGGQS